MSAQQPNTIQYVGFFKNVKLDTGKYVANEVELEMKKFIEWASSLSSINVDAVEPLINLCDEYDFLTSSPDEAFLENTPEDMLSSADGRVNQELFVVPKTV